MEEEALINLVSEYRELYDTEHNLYQDHSRREAVWQEIAKRFEQPAHECRDRWKRLRDNYSKAKKHRQIKKRQGATKLKPIKHHRVISFLDHIEESVNNPTESFIDDSDAGLSSGMFQEKQKEMSNASINTMTIFERPYLGETVKCDPVVAFFINLGETVKSFPEAVQIRVKRDIFKIVNDAEEKVLNMR